MLDVRTWAGKQQAGMKSVIRDMEKVHMQVCSIWKCTKALVPFHGFYSVLCPGEVMTVNTVQGLSMTKPLATQTLEGALPPFT